MYIRSFARIRQHCLDNLKDSSRQNNLKACLPLSQPPDLNKTSLSPKSPPLAHPANVTMLGPAGRKEMMRHVAQIPSIWWHLTMPYAAEFKLVAHVLGAPHSNISDIDNFEMRLWADSERCFSAILMNPYIGYYGEAFFTMGGGQFTVENDRAPSLWIDKEDDNRVVSYCGRGFYPAPKGGLVVRMVDGVPQLADDVDGQFYVCRAPDDISEKLQIYWREKSADGPPEECVDINLIPRCVHDIRMTKDGDPRCCINVYSGKCRIVHPQIPGVDTPVAGFMQGSIGTSEMVPKEIGGSP